MKKREQKVSDEVAFQELKDLVQEHSIVSVQDDEIKETRPAVYEAIKSGLLVTSGEKPVFTLSSPIKNESGDEVLNQVEFNTRITPNQQVRLAKGLNIQKQQLEYALKLTAFTIGQPVSYLDKMSKFDYAVVQELSSLFL